MFLVLLRSTKRQMGIWPTSKVDRLVKDQLHGMNPLRSYKVKTFRQQNDYDHKIIGK